MVLVYMNEIRSRILKTAGKIRREFSKKDPAMGVIEVILIIVVLVGLAFIFKTRITAIANGIYDMITEQVDKF